jgi:2-dehydro-3-deoxyglucarate aldolase
MNTSDCCFPLRQALLERRVTIGSWIQAAHPAIAEVLANAGYDWIALECEHSENDVSEFAAVARAMHGRRAAPVVRVRENDTLVIRRMLDMGAQGVLVPLIHTAEDATKAVRAAKYPPVGVRGYCFSRMNDWGVKFDDYLQRANDETAVVVMIESKEGVANIDSILSVEGVDGIFIGPYDLTGSYGVPGKVTNPLIMEAREKVLKACRRHEKAAGLHIVLPTSDAIKKAIGDGFTFLCIGSDMIGLNEVARAYRKTAIEAANEG